MVEWKEHLTMENVITKKFKKASRVIKMEDLIFNKTFLEICSHIYFLFYHDYRFKDTKNKPESQKLLEAEDTSIPKLESSISGLENLENIMSGKSYTNFQSTDSLPNIQHKHFSFCENNIQLKSLPYSLVLNSLLKEINPLNDENEETESVNKENTAISFNEQDMEVKIHAGLFDTLDNKLDQDAVDTILGNERDDGNRQYGVGVDVFRLLTAAMDQGL